MQVHEIFFPRRNCKIHREKLSIPRATAYQMSSTAPFGWRPLAGSLLKIEPAWFDKAVSKEKRLILKLSPNEPEK